LGFFLLVNITGLTDRFKHSISSLTVSSTSLLPEGTFMRLYADLTALLHPSVANKARNRRNWRWSEVEMSLYCRFVYIWYRSWVLSTAVCLWCL